MRANLGAVKIERGLCGSAARPHSSALAPPKTGCELSGCVRENGELYVRTKESRVRDVLKVRPGAGAKNPIKRASPGYFSPEHEQRTADELPTRSIFHRGTEVSEGQRRAARRGKRFAAHPPFGGPRPSMKRRAALGSDWAARVWRQPRLGPTAGVRTPEMPGKGGRPRRGPTPKNNAYLEAGKQSRS
ncbi:hypothetical protein NDU88_003038 [Pleurodeles waltl]|uniref:Uncharacterized protein n=1 Tax=Pleurodeles waltl TaxID=8319 RepID=A0AAV7MUH7_PLEWA|nr:hypothetical protein NDU88_003038 [Pleurodeles waltl]